MLIGDKYKLEADNLNLILYKKVTPEQLQEEALLELANEEEPDETQTKLEGIVDTTDTNIKWKLLGYFRTVEGVLYHLINNEIIEGVNLRSLEQIVAGQRELAMLIVSLDFKDITLKTLMEKDKPQPIV